MLAGPWPVRERAASSRNVTPGTQCKEFSMARWRWTALAKAAAVRGLEVTPARVWLLFLPVSCTVASTLAMAAMAGKRGSPGKQRSPFSRSMLDETLALHSSTRPWPLPARVSALIFAPAAPAEGGSSPVRCFPPPSLPGPAPAARAWRRLRPDAKPRVRSSCHGCHARSFHQSPPEPAHRASASSRRTRKIRKQPGIDPVQHDPQPARAGDGVMKGHETPHERQVILAPFHKLIEIVAGPDRPAHHQQQDLGQQMRHTPALAIILKQTAMIQQNRQTRAITPKQGCLLQHPSLESGPRQPR